MIGWLVSTLRDNPQLAIFLALAIGYWVGAMSSAASAWAR